ncbi:MAG TPA: hypothetical protein RMH99_27340 [Sandaracinaceae bacterium LLY-WYZ-13_1]|nr:hypothetical protein [Sandaracinaceae bacterium LLY-WYZ-13_1]
MRRIGICLACCTALALGAGCDDRDPDITLMDSGSGDGDDAGMMMGDPDSGPMTDPDSGSMTRECEMNLDPFPAALGPRCSADTQTCLEACADGACINTCLMNDDTPPEMSGSVSVDCAFCIQYNQFYCLEQNGSADQVHAFNCCIEDNSCMNQACVDANCSAEQSAIQSSPGASTCLGVPTGGDFAVCFP